MAVSTGKVGRGTKLELAPDDNSANPVWAAVTNITRIAITGRSSEEVDITLLDSEGGFRELQQGLRDGGNLEFGVHFDPNDATYTNAQKTGVLDLFNSGGTIRWRVNMKGAGIPFGLVGRGYVSNPGDLTFENSAPISGTSTIRTRGPTTLVAIP